MEISREQLASTYSARTDLELAMIEESELTETALEVLREVKRQRNMGSETSECAVRMEREKIQREKRASSRKQMKKYLLYLWLLCVILAVEPFRQRGLVLVPVILMAPCVLFLLYDRYRTRRRSRF